MNERTRKIGQRLIIMFIILVLSGIVMTLLK